MLCATAALFYCYLGWLSRAGCQIDARGPRCTLDLVFWTKPVAYQSLDLFPESFVDQGIYKGIDG